MWTIVQAQSFKIQPFLDKSIFMCPISFLPSSKGLFFFFSDSPQMTSCTHPVSVPTLLGSPTSGKIGSQDWMNSPQSLLKDKHALYKLHWPKQQ